jgi:hypothetical protein
MHIVNDDLHHHIIDLEKERERAAKALALNGIDVNTAPVEDPFQLKAASSYKKKPTVRINRDPVVAKLKSPLTITRSTFSASLPTNKLKAAASLAPVQIASVIPSHLDEPVPERPGKTALMIKTSCLGCGAKATQVLHFEPGKEMRPTRNPQILPKLCQACKGDMYCEYSGSALR